MRINGEIMCQRAHTRHHRASASKDRKVFGSFFEVLICCNLKKIVKIWVNIAKYWVKNGLG